jgi:hypothetical protein
MAVCALKMKNISYYGCVENATLKRVCVCVRERERGVAKRSRLNVFKERRRLLKRALGVIFPLCLAFRPMQIPRSGVSQALRCKLDFLSPAGMEHVHEDETTNRDVRAAEFGREEQRSLEEKQRSLQEKTRELCCFNNLVHQK